MVKLPLKLQQLVGSMKSRKCDLVIILQRITLFILH